MPRAALPALAVLAALLPGPVLAFSGVVLWHGRPGADSVAAQGQRDPLARHGTLDAGTPLHIGSITKLFTAVLVMQQVGAHKLSLDLPIGALLPELPPAAGAVTVRQLLQHQSGLPVWNAEVLEREGQPPQIVQPIPSNKLGAAVLAVAAQPPRAAPGAGFFYNNLDYLLLGLLLERCTGQAYADLLNARLLEPLGLRHTALATSPGDAAGVARSATVEAGRLKPALATPLANYGAAGALVSTASDLSRFAAALLEGRALAPPLRAQLFAEGLSVWPYAFKDQGLPTASAAVERQGAVGSYRSTLVLLPETQRFLIVLANTDGEDYSTWLPTSFTHRLLAGVLAGAPVRRALRAALSAAPQPRQ